MSGWRFQGTMSAVARPSANNLKDAAALISGLESRRAQLLQDLYAIDTLICSEKARYHKLLNRNLPISKLPNELLNSILLIAQSNHFVRSPRSRPFEITASHVSSHWREVVLGTPLLWKVIDQFVRNFGHVNAYTFQKLQAYLFRSGTCPLDMTFTFEVEPDAYIDLLLPHSNRWQRLSIFSKSSQVQHVSASLRDMAVPCLEHLSLTFGSRQDVGQPTRTPYATLSPQILLQGAPLLTFLRLAGAALGTLQPPYSSISTLHLDGWTRNYMSHFQFKTILDTLPSLRNLSLNQIWIHHPRDPLTVLSSTILPSLRSLRLRGAYTPLHRLLSFMVLPNLVSLSLVNIESFDPIEIPTVQYLTLESCLVDDVETWNIINAFPAVINLTVDDSIPDIYFVLTPSLNMPNVPLPGLSKLSIKDLQPIDIASFCAMVNLRAGSKKPIKFMQLDRRSRTVLRTKHRLEWLQNEVAVSNWDFQEPWPRGLGYDDTHDYLD